MTKQVINVGTTANDRKGDSLRAAFQKVNANFTELYTAVENISTGEDVDLTGYATEQYVDDAVGAIEIPDVSNFITAADIPTDFKGSVFADDSTLLVDAVSGKIVGEVDTLVGSIVNLESVNFGVENISARNQFGVNIGAGGFNNLVVLENEVRIQNVPFNVGSNDIILTSNNNEAGRITTSNSSIQIQAEVDFEIRVNQTFDAGTPEEETETALWSFESNGELYFPDGTIQTTAYTGGIDSDPTQLLFEAGEDEDLVSHSAGFVEGDPVFQIRLNTHLSGEEQIIWGFDTDGNLEAPGDITAAGTITGNILQIEDGVHEKYQTKTDATGTVTHDCSQGHIFYHTSPDANWTVNLTNLNLASGYATAITLIIEQGSTGYYPSALEIAGSDQGTINIRWQGGSAPTPSTDAVDVVTFSIINDSNLYTTLGQLTGF